MVRTRGIRKIEVLAFAGLLTVAVTPELATGQGDGHRPGARLPMAEIVRPSGIEASLLDGPRSERLRVAILLIEQPVLEEATEPGFEASLSGYTRGDLQAAARRSPAGVSELEVEAAADSERRRTEIVSGLQDEVAEAERLQRPVERAVERAGGEVVAEAQTGALAMVTAELERSSVARIGERADVQAVLAAPKPEPDLNTSTMTIAASPVWAQHNGGGDDGAGGAADVRTNLEVGMGGDSVDGTHSAFSGITVNNGTSTPADHGTATAGVLVSRDGVYRGVAHGVPALRSGNADVFNAPDPVDVRSESFGYDPTSDENANVVDLQADTFAVPWAASAGNGNDDIGITPGSPTTGGDAMGRNILSTGAIGDNSTEAEADNLVADFSSFGPSPGGRKKPDLTAPGVAITTANVGGGFDPESGTSLSAPHVGGALAILAGAGMTDPRAMRAVLVNSAQPWCNGHNHNPPAGTSLTAVYPSGTCQDRWMPDVGWGELDVEDAIAERGNAVIGDVAAGKARFYSATTDPGDRATLAWNMRGVIGPDVTQHVYFAVTNLNLRQYRVNGAEIQPLADPGWGAGPDAVDANDTVEQVRAPTGPADQVIYKVSADSTVEGQATERFGLASANPLTALESPDVDPTQVSQSGVGPVNCTSDQVTVAARLANPSSDLEATGSQLTLELPAGLELVSGSATQAVSGGTLAADETSEQVSWTVRATGSGNHTPVLRGDGTAFATTFTNREDLSAISADCSPPQVSPNGFEVRPASEVTCGELQTVSASFTNPTQTDAPNARAALDLPAGAELVSGPQTQIIAGGTLGRGQSSQPHAWQLRLPSPAAGDTASGTVTVSGLNDANGQPSTASTMVHCSLAAEPPPTAKGMVRLRDAELRYERRAGKVVASGRLTGSKPIRVGGSANVELRRPAGSDQAGAARTISRTVDLDSNGRFETRIGACREGRYRAWVTWRGDEAYEPLPSTPIDRTRSRGC